MSANIRYQSLGHYRGVELFATVKDGRMIFVAWLDKFYSALSTAPLYDLIDSWWKTRMN